MKKYLFMVTAALALTIHIQSQTIINAGPVSGTWTVSGSPYHIMGDIIVPAGYTLVIEPGATVKIYTELSIKVYGQLLAEGNVTDSVFFIPITEYWKGLQLLNSQDTTIIRYCKFTNFKKRTDSDSFTIKGGVIYVINSKLIIANSLFYNNLIELQNYSFCYGKGGAIYSENAFVIITQNYFIGNRIFGEWNDCGEGYGGAVFSISGYVNINENHFLQNTVEITVMSGSWAESKCFGGGIYTTGLVENNLIQENQCISIAIGEGYIMEGEGSAYSYGGGIFGGTVINNEITNNLCQADGSGGGEMEWGGYGSATCLGGGIHNATLVENNIIRNNNCIGEASAWAPYAMCGASSHSMGGGVSGSGLLKSNLIKLNSVSSSAYADYNYAESLGGGIYQGSHFNNTVVNNSVQANAPGGTFDLLGAGIQNGTIKNCIIFDNIGASQVSNASATYSCIQGGYSGQGNISGDPLFVNPSQGDYHLKQPPCQTQLSSCVDAGDPTTPLIFGTTRTDEYPDLGTMDMGFHYQLPITFIADFYTNINYGEFPYTVNFINNSYVYLTSVLLYEWDFDNDGLIDSFEENPTWTYPDIGNYSVKLIITSQDTDEILTDTLLRENYIHVCYIESGFIQDTISGWNPLTIQFIDTSDVINTAISVWRWDFNNDGIIDSYQQNPEFVFEDPGLFTVKLMVTDSSGYITDTTIKENLIIVNGVMADFEAEPVLGYLPLSVNFSNTSLSHNVEITGLKWDFQNDGIIDSYEENPFWTYSESGFYSVKLILTGESTNGLVNDTIIKENIITANELIAEFHSTTTYGQIPLQIHFYDDSYTFPINYGQINCWQWDFQNDGIIDSYVQNPFLTISEPGLYSVKLISGNAIYTVYDTILKTDFITVCTMIPGLYAEPLSGIVPMEVDFFDTSFVEYTQISTWIWDFQHDGIIDAYGPNPTWTYPEAGIYSVELRITDTSGQIWKSVVKEDYIQVNPITGFPQLSKESINDKLKIYPNPFTNDLIIEFEFDNPDVVTVQIFDVAFKPVATITKDEKVSAGVKNWKWGSQTNNNPSGIYYISLQTFSDKQYIKKCIKVE